MIGVAFLQTKTKYKDQDCSARSLNPSLPVIYFYIFFNIQKSGKSFHRNMLRGKVTAASAHIPIQSDFKITKNFVNLRSLNVLFKIKSQLTSIN